MTTSRSQPTRAIAGALALMMVVVGLTACGDSSPEALTITGNGTGYQGLPSRLDAGVWEMTFNNGADAADGPLFLEMGETSVDQFLADFAVVLEGGPVPSYLTKAAGFPTTPSGGASTETLTMPAGNYLFLSFFDDDRDPVYQTVEVTGDGADLGDLPSADATIAASDYTFAITGVEAGTQTLEFSNNGPAQFHHAVVVRFPDGTSAADAEANMKTLFELEEGEAPPEGTVEPDEAFDTGVFSPGSGATFEATFEAGGTYAVLCFIGDRQGGPPHAIAYNMMKAFTVDA